MESEFDNDSWVVVQATPYVEFDETKDGLARFSINGNFTYMASFPNKKDAEEYVEKRKSYSNLIIQKSINKNILVPRDKLRELREIVFGLENNFNILMCPREVSEKLKHAHNLIYEMQNYK